MKAVGVLAIVLFILNSSAAVGQAEPRRNPPENVFDPPRGIICAFRFDRINATLVQRKAGGGLEKGASENLNRKLVAFPIFYYAAFEIGMLRVSIQGREYIINSGLVEYKIDSVYASDLARAKSDTIWLAQRRLGDPRIEDSECISGGKK